MALVSSRAAVSCLGTCVGRSSACGSFEKKRFSLLQDRWSAISLSTPAMCLAVRVKWCSASMLNRHCKRCIECMSLLV